MPALGGVNSTTSVATSAELAAHTDDATAVHAASAIAFTPAGTVAATTVQAAIEEVAAEGSGIPQGGPLTEDLLAGGFLLKGADAGGAGGNVAIADASGDDGGSVAFSGGSSADDNGGGSLTALGAADGSGGASVTLAGGDGATGLPGGNALLRSGRGDDNNDERAHFRAYGGDGAGNAGRVEIQTNDDTGDSGDVLTAQGDGTALWAASGGALTPVTVNLTAGQIATLSSVPVEVVAAPGANKVIVPVAASFQYKAGAVGFDASSEVSLGLGLGAPLVGGTVAFADLDDMVTILAAAAPTADLQADVANAPLLLVADIEPDGAGDGTARLTVLYYVMDLAV